MQIPPSSTRSYELVCQWLVLGLLLAYTLTPAQANDSARPVALRFDSNLQVFSLVAIDKQWDLSLTPKRLLSNISVFESAMQGLPLFFDGNVIGDASSWVRLTVEDIGDGIYTGYIFTQNELYELQYDDIGGHTLLLMPSGLALGNMTRAAPPNPSQGAGARLPATASSKPNEATSSNTTRTINIGVAIDSAYDEFYGKRGLAHALSIINGVDGLYQNQLGLAITVQGYRVYDDPEQDPLRNYPGSLDQILGSYRDIRMQDRTLPAELALVHLFSGHSDPNKVIGLGWTDTMCRLDGYDLSVSTPFPYDMLLAAHEIAHNLGAVHDDSAACSTDDLSPEQQIMWSEISDSTQPQFSDCSLASMRPALSAACVVNTFDADVQISTNTTEQTQDNRPARQAQ